MALAIDSGRSQLMAANDPITQERVYRALKAEYLAGRYHAGERLDIQDIADRHGSSKTPVREAACRLMGERLVEPDSAGGFRVAIAAPQELIHLYAWNAHLLLCLTQRIKRSVLSQTLAQFSPDEIGETPVAIAKLTGSVFLALAASTGNPEAAATVSQINERLFYPRVDGAANVSEAAKELRTMTNSDVVDVHKSIHRRIESYHERRIAHQQEIIQNQDVRETDR
jgi:DNA-binding GntR family transcriptional regulator